jgi:preprotein translocase subunit SecG
MTTFLLTTQIVLAVILTLVVLFQKSSSIGLGAYSGTNESVFGAKGPANFLSKMTFFFGFLFVANTIALGFFYNQERSATVLDSVTIVPKNISSEASSNESEIPLAPVTQ